ncbi:sigma 54-interacting transcriptional regulator, partial [Myxococcota bacterium]|nr:sigma 54-interacting transcriptional regulator [Myxococcota bacterium]
MSDERDRADGQAALGAGVPASETPWQSVVELMSDAVFLVGPDRRIVSWNRAAEALTGYTREEVLGQHCLTAIHCTQCESRCGVFEHGGVREVPLRLKARDGRELEVIKNATVLEGPNGEPSLAIEVLRDVTAWREREQVAVDAQHAAEAQRSLLRSVLDGVTDGLVGVASCGQVRFVSAAAERALGVVEEQAVGKDIADVAGPEAQRIAEHVIRSGGTTNPDRVAHHRADGIDVPLALSGSPLVLPDGSAGAMILVHDLREDERRMRERLRAQGFAYGALVSRSPRMQEVFDLVDQVAPSGATILIQGESGTGKELVARELHRRSRRAAGPFHAVSCAAIAPEILESEFFGHERGAFTGAVVQKPGRFEVAHTGTIFLDEVGELPLQLQAKLLRVLEERAFERVGGTQTISVDVRVIAATHRDLAQMVREGAFREDLFYRLRVVPVRLPALRERMEDVEALANHFLRRITEREQRAPLVLAPDALRALLDHPWPGNVRELANAMEYAAVVAKTREITLADLPRELRISVLATQVSPARDAEPPAARGHARGHDARPRAPST